MDVGFKLYEKQDIFCFSTLTNTSILQVYIVFGTAGLHIHMYKPSRETSGKEMMSLYFCKAANFLTIRITLKNSKNNFDVQLCL
jgi:hypothetical protein